jgi:hypothetical protein
MNGYLQDCMYIHITDNIYSVLYVLSKRCILHVPSLEKFVQPFATNHIILLSLTIGSQEMYVDFIVVSESEIALNTRAWKLSWSRNARVGIVITMIHRIYKAS